MSTRGMIVRVIRDETDKPAFKGVYHHWDGYPAGLGASLYDALKNKFDGNLGAFLKYAIDEHPAGWSSFEVRKPGETLTKHNPFTKEDTHLEAFGPNDEHCYCHGWRSEEAQDLDGTEDIGCEFGYAFDETEGLMLVLERVYHSGEFKGEHATGMFGCGPGEDKAGWKVLKRINLATDPAPDWDAIG